jgi:hypothetical protein
MEKRIDYLSNASSPNSVYFPKYTNTAIFKFLNENPVTPKFLDVLKCIASLSWIKVNPTRQYTGSFNPTNTDYLKGTPTKNVVLTIKSKDEELLDIISEFLPKDLATIIFKYTGGECYNNYFKLLNVIKNSVKYIKQFYVFNTVLPKN